MNYPRLKFCAVLFSLALLLAGCKQQTPYTIADTKLPDYAEGVKPTTSTLSMAGPNRVQETMTFGGVKPDVLEQYAQYLQKNGWTRQAETTDLTSQRVILTQAEKRITLDYAGRSGLTITGARPGTP